MKETNLKVTGMHCEGCENRIKNALNSMEEIIEVKANHIDGMVYIKANKDINMEKIKEILDDLGFEIEGN